MRAGGTGDVTGSHVAYYVRRAMPYVPTPVYDQGRLYTINDGGIASALDAATGLEIWSGRTNAEFFSSLVLIEGRVFAATSKGEMIVLAAGDTFQVLARNPLGEGTRSTPIVADGRLYVKTFTHLVCVGAR